MGDPMRIDAPMLAQDRCDLIPQHDATSDPLMRNDGIAELLDGMRKGVMPDIVQQGRRADGAGVFVRDPLRIGAGSQMFDCLAGKVEDPDGMLETGVPGARPDARDESKLLNPLEPQEGLRIDHAQLGICQRHDIVQTVAQHGRNREPGSKGAPESRFWM